MKESEVAAGDAGDCGDGPAVGEAGVVQGAAGLPVKPRSAGYRSARAGRAGRPAPGGSVVSQSSRIYFGYEIQDSESNILTPS